MITGREIDIGCKMKLGQSKPGLTEIVKSPCTAIGESEAR